MSNGDVVFGQRQAWGLLFVVLGSLAVVEGREVVRRPAEVEVEPVRLSINCASADDLQRLPGLGPSLAARMVRYRRQHGPFVSVADIVNVSGVGETRLRRWRPVLSLGEQCPSSTAASPPAAASSLVEQ